MDDARYVLLGASEAGSQAAELRAADDSHRAEAPASGAWRAWRVSRDRRQGGGAGRWSEASLASREVGGGEVEGLLEGGVHLLPGGFLRDAARAGARARALKVSGGDAGCLDAVHLLQEELHLRLRHPRRRLQLHCAKAVGPLCLRQRLWHLQFQRYVRQMHHPRELPRPLPHALRSGSFASA